MAIWQVSFLLVKRNGVLRCSDQNLLNSLEKLNAVFPEEKSWCENARQFGALESTCIQIFVSDNEEDDEINLRIDLRNITKVQIQNICDFVNENELQIEYENKLYEATMNNFVEILSRSDVYRFVRNPFGFFEEISEKNQ